MKYTKDSLRYTYRRISIPGTIALILLTAFIVLPFYILIVGAFKPNVSLLSVPMDLVPFKDFTFKSLQKALDKADLLHWLFNSIVISGAVALINSFIGIAAGYAFARIKFRGKKLFFALVLATMMMPKQMLLIPNYLVARSLNLQNTMYGVILTTVAPAFGIFLSRQYIFSLPGSLFDAAEIDGCSEVGKFFKIALPLALPSAGTIAIFSFFGCFNDYIWQLLMISGEDLMTMPIGLAFMMSRLGRAESIALAFISTLPLIIIFLACQKMFIKGATVGAVKG